MPPPVLPTLSVADATVTEGNSGTSDLAFTVTLSAAATSPVTVAYATANGTATAGSDYAASAGTLTFAAGETSKVVHVQVTGDTAVEANETLTLTLSSPNGATIAHGTATGTIVNDDTAPLPTLSIGDSSFAEGSAAAPGHGAFTVTLSAAATAPVTVHFATADGTATAGSDYVAQSGTLTFAAGETQKTITVAAIGDSTVEANEGFTVTLSSPTGATIAHGTGSGTIVNDDAAPPPPRRRSASPTPRSSRAIPAARRGAGLAQHVGQPDRRQRRTRRCRSPASTGSASRSTNMSPARAVGAQLQGHDGPDGGARLQHDPPALLQRQLLRRRQRPTASTSPRTPTCRASTACRSWTRSSPMPARSA